MSERNPIPWRLIAIASILVNLMLAAPLIQKSRTINSIYHYDCTITARDSRTGEVIKIGGVSGPGTSSMDVFRQVHISSFTREGRLKVSGTACEPRTLGIGADGYFSQNYVISDDVPFGSFDVLLESKPEASKE
mgnify:CR=1 FL=1